MRTIKLVNLGYAAVVVLAALLGACTGSYEAPNPILLVTGYQDTTGANVALIRDDTDPRVRNNRLTFLPASVRTLPAPAVSYDVVDRERARSAVVVLSRSPTNGPTGADGFLTTFSLTGIDPDNPVAFAKRSQVTINTFQPVTALPNPIFCASRVQVSQGGDYAAVLNTPSLCGLQAQPFIDILDLRSSRLLERLTNVNGVSSSGFYLSQDVTQDLLYYATTPSGSLEVQRAVLPRPGQQFGIGDTIVSTLVTSLRTPPGQNDARDLQRAGADTEERLVFLFRNSLVNVTNFGVGGTARVGSFTDTPSRDNAFVIRDDARRTEATFVMSTPQAGVFAYVPPPGDDTEQASARVRAVDAVIEPTQDLIYFVIGSEAVPQNVGNVALFSIGAYDPGDPLPNPASDAFAVPQLTAPSFVTWTRAVIPITPQQTP